MLKPVFAFIILDLNAYTCSISINIILQIVLDTYNIYLLIFFFLRRIRKIFRLQSMKLVSKVKKKKKYFRVSLGDLPQQVFRNSDFIRSVSDTLIYIVRKILLINLPLHTRVKYICIFMYTYIIRVSRYFHRNINQFNKNLVTIGKTDNKL